VGPEVAQSVSEFFRKKRTREIIRSLLELGIEIKSSPRHRGALPFDGKTFVFTGILEEFTRDEAQRLVESLGGRASSSVSRKTDYVVAGKNPGSKYSKARDLGVMIISEKEFRNLIGSI
jgi:DNA ligase (NAD+)